MKKRILSAVSLFVFAVTSTGWSLAQPGPKKVLGPETSRLLSQLPESDAVVLVDSRRFFDDTLPKVLASKPAILAKITAKVDEIQQRTSIDLRKFDQLAIGAKISKFSEKDFDADPVVIARGTFNPGAMVSMAKIASNGTYREEKIGTHTVSIFSVKDIANKTAAKANDPGVSGAVQSATNSFDNKELAVTAIDTNTLAIGTVNRVRETLEGKTHVGSDLLGLLAPYDHAVMSFAVHTPSGLAQFTPMDNDELGKNLAAIRYLAGSMDMAAGAANVEVLIRAARADQADGLLDTLEGLQGLGKALLSNSKKPEYKVYAHLVDSAKIAKSGADVTVDISVPQSDIDALLAMVK
jgi:hypothetical protein